MPDNLVGVAVDPGTSPSSVAAAIEVSSITASFDLIVGMTSVIVAVVTGFFFIILTVPKLRVFAGLRAIGATSP